MKKILQKLIFFILLAAYAKADPFPPGPSDGEIHWRNGLRYVYDLAGNTWAKYEPTTGWETITKAANFTVDKEYKELLILANGTFTVDIESAATLGINFSFAVKNVGAGVITIDADLVETIDGSLTLALTGLYDTVELVSDGTNWHVVTGYTSTMYTAIEPGTADGQMLFWDNTGAIWSHSETNELYWDDVSKELGIGDTSPDAKLSINGGTGTLSTGISLGDGDSGIYESADDYIEITAAGEGATIRKTVAEDGQMLIDEVILGRSEFKDEMWATLAGEWITRTSTGSRLQQSLPNGVFKFTTGATATNEEAIDWNDVCTFSNTEQPSYRWRIKLEQVTNIEVDFGLIEASTGGNDDYIKIYFDSSAYNYWLLRTCLGGVCVEDPGAIADTDWHIFQMNFINDGFIQWLIDGVSQGSLASQIPTVQLQPFFSVRTEENIAHYVDVDFAEYRQDRE